MPDSDTSDGGLVVTGSGVQCVVNRSKPRTWVLSETKLEAWEDGVGDLRCVLHLKAHIVSWSSFKIIQKYSCFTWYIKSIKTIQYYPFLLLLGFDLEHRCIRGIFLQELPGEEPFVLYILLMWSASSKLSNCSKREKEITNAGFMFPLLFNSSLHKFI